MKTEQCSKTHLSDKDIKLSRDKKKIEDKFVRAAEVNVEVG